MNGKKRKHSNFQSCERSDHCDDIIHYNCQRCERCDHYDDMVQCDHCDDLYHFRCVGVTKNISNLKWYCPECVEVLLEQKICISNIESIPDLWIRCKNAEKYFLCPVNLSIQQFVNAAKNSFNPMSNWQKIKCQVLESKFKTYQQAKAAEDSIVRNLELQKRNVSDTKRKRRVEDRNVRKVAANLNAKEIEKLISDRVESAISQRMKDVFLRPTGANAEGETHVGAAVTETIVQDGYDVGTMTNVPDVMLPLVDDEINVGSEANAEGETHVGAAVTETIVQDGCDVGTMTNVADVMLPLVDDEINVGSEANAEGETQVGAAVTETIGLDGYDVDTMVNVADVMLALVNDEVDVGSEANFTNSDMESYLPVKREEHLVELEYELIKNLMYLRQKHGKKGGEKLYTTMRIVSNSIIADEFLENYSFKGQKSKKKQKLPFNVYPNVYNLIALATMDAHNSYNANVPGFVELTEEEVKDFFRNNFIKYAHQRVK